MRIMIATLMLVTASHLWAQDSGGLETENLNTPGESTNPFDEPASVKDDYDDMMDMGMGMDELDTPEPDLEANFRRGLQRAIKMLKKSKNETSKEIIRDYIRTAFSQRYDRMIDQRKKDVERLRKSITQLENDLQRRTAAKKRVVELQLQSVQLAAEGLLEIDDPQPAMRGFGGMGDSSSDGGFVGGLMGN